MFALLTPFFDQNRLLSNPTCFFFRYLTLLLLHLANQEGRRGQKQEAASRCPVALFRLPSAKPAFHIIFPECLCSFHVVFVGAYGLTTVSAEQEGACVKTKKLQR